MEEYFGLQDAGDPEEQKQVIIENMVGDYIDEDLMFFPEEDGANSDIDDIEN